MSLKIPPCHDRFGTPLYRGGYADVWKGDHQGRQVAVKVLRVYSTNDFEKITSVGSRSLSLRRTRQLILPVPEVLQRGCNLEDSSPSKRATLVGGNDG